MGQEWFGCVVIIFLTRKPCKKEYFERTTKLKGTKQKTAHIHKEKIGRKLDYLVTSFTETAASHSKIRLKVENGEIIDNKFRKDHGALSVWLTMAMIRF